MALNTPEQILLDYIETNSEVREHWLTVISTLTEDIDPVAASITLGKKLHEYYWENPINLEQIAFLLGPNGLLHANLTNVAASLLKLGLENDKPDIIKKNKESDRRQSAYYILRTGIKSGPYTLKQLISMWGSGSITSDTLFWSDTLRDWVSIKDLTENENIFVETQPLSHFGSRERPIPIVSLLTKTEATMSSEVDKLYGAYNWKKISWSGDTVSGRWNILLGDGTTRVVWFDLTPSQSLRLSNLDKSHPAALKTLTPKQQKEFNNIVVKSLQDIDFNSDKEIRNRLKKGEKDGGGSLCGALMGFLMVVAFFAAIFSLIYGLFLAALISTPLIYVFEKLSKFFNGKETRRFFCMVQGKLDAAYEEFKSNNPGEKLTQSGDDESERAEFRKCWAVKNDFQLPDEIK